jgi:hypothetical protein
LAEKGGRVSHPRLLLDGCSRRESLRKRGGVGFLVREEVVEVSSRILGLFVKVGNMNIWLFQVYAPVNDATKGEKDKFWKDLRDVIEKKCSNSGAR